MIGLQQPAEQFHGDGNIRTNGKFIVNGIELELPGPGGVYQVRARSGSGKEALIRVLKGPWS